MVMPGSSWLGPVKLIFAFRSGQVWLGNLRPGYFRLVQVRKCCDILGDVRSALIRLCKFGPS